MGQTSRVQLYVVCAFGSFDTNFIICRIYVEIFINYPFFLYFPPQEHNSVKENRESLGNINEYFSNIVYFSTFNMESSKLINYVFIIQQIDMCWKGYKLKFRIFNYTHCQPNFLISRLNKLLACKFAHLLLKAQYAQFFFFFINFI